MDVSEIAVYLKHALEQREPGLLNTALGVITDIAQTDNNNIGEYLADFVPQLGDVIVSKDLDK